ncbi:MAG: M28 family peptidase, partial [Armatimonadetes bacterium]|nr:M28 family peptidase [Armatimonadota bacterium]
SWINAWSDDPGGWALTARDARGWSFQISPRQGERLRARLRSGEKLRGRALVHATIEPGTLPAVTGVIPGSGREEVLLLGHQFEQGMVDNAGGVGIMIEVARALQSLISAGKLPAPQRSIRFLFMSECYSTLHWVGTARRASRTAAGVCIDAPCAVAEYATKPLEFSLNPSSQMTYVDALILAVARQVMADRPLYAWREIPFAMGTDNMIADSSIGIPCPWIGSHSRTWHNSADVPEVLDSECQEFVARIAAAYAYLIAAADGNRALDFAHLAAARGKAVLAEAGIRELEARSERELDDSLGQLAYLAERQAEAVGSVLKLLPSPQRAGVRAQVRALQREVKRLGRDEIAALARRAGQPSRTPASPHPPGPLDAIRPRRLVPGTLTFDSLEPTEREGRPSPRWSATLFAILSWCNGRRSLADASHLAARELRRDRTLSPDELIKEVDPEAPSLLDYFEFLRQHNYVTW